ncbi:helicase [Methylovirgula ligni]|uniref:ATP-dependent RNA helicase SUPV3L1/SUV3 n=1 Tax=Methylovirgula ligni TaxID=569860 RepID=A0A3D9Z1B1_9HYPH|nr:helicase-related protein [Methylovirgula ligni]QAY94366.1 helicase [Methylovirgula ligni]REF87790.1 ATP-dependent RNA helicase SUPV3L1/SUV3 [Methylovirgula ligni]
MNLPISGPQIHPLERARGVRIILGPTNTGKTHYAIERMLAHRNGMIGLPLRLLAREVYNRVVEKVGPAAVALITGEEKIKPEAPRYWVSTVEAMPRDLNLSFVAVDEIQLAADLDRGHIFTDRLLNRRGSEETLLIGASTMQRSLEQLLPGAPIISRPRLSKLSFAGERKIARLPPRSAIVAFSVEEVYAIAEWIRRQRGGAAVVLGALSPRTRNAQVEIYQNGDVDYIVATDAIGMGLNLDVDHIAFAGDRKFDGWQYRRLTPAEFGQIAGRAGRHMRDGTFGTTGRCAPFDAELVEALEDHHFDPVRMLQWRNSELDFSSIAALGVSLDRQPQDYGLTRAPLAEDQMVLDIAGRDENVLRVTKTTADVSRLWDACQIPDYRKLSPAAHAELVLSIYGFTVRARHIPEDWFARHIHELDRVDGDLDTLSARIAQVRTWTFIANRPDWLRDPEHWQEAARQVEDRLSDALHERLAQRFIDRRTSVLMRRLRENAMLEAEITPGGDVLVEAQHVGHLSGFRFTADPQADGEAAKALNAAAQKALASEIEGRARRVHEAVDEAFVLANDGIIRWLGEAVAKIVPGEHILQPRIAVLADEQLTGASLELVQTRLDLWLAQHVKKLLGPLSELESGEGLEGIARGVAFRIAESLGVLERSQVAEDVKSLTQEARATLRKLGVRFGAYHLYLPALLKPAPRAFAAQLWALRNPSNENGQNQADIPHLAASGRTSFPADKAIPKGYYRAAGFHVCGERAVRVDILERLADLIRPAIAYRPGTTPGDPPSGSADGDGFVVTVAMTSLAGCSGESFAAILRALGYQSEQRQGPAITVPLLPKAATEPVTPPVLSEPAVEASEDIVAEMAESAVVPEAEGEPIDSIAAPADEVADAVEAFPPEEPIAAPEPASEVVVAEPVADEGEPVVAAADEAATEATPAEATAEAAPGEPAVTEPVLIEIWRPLRHRQARRPARPQRHAAARGHHRSPAPATDAVAAAEAGAPPTAPEMPPLEHRRPPRRHRPNAEAATAGGAPRPDDRRDKKRDFSPKEAHRGSRNGETRGKGQWTSAERPRERQPDPNSPFAKLAILKQRMEEGKT